MVLRCCFCLCQLTYLPPPWGDCKATPMDSDFFNTYSITACRIDCETRYLVENCNCRMVHMPGRNQKGILLLDTKAVYLHLFIKIKMLQCLLMLLEVLSFEIVVTKAIFKEQTAICQRLQMHQILSHSSDSENSTIFTLCLCSDYSWHLLSSFYI